MKAVTFLFLLVSIFGNTIFCNAQEKKPEQKAKQVQNPPCAYRFGTIFINNKVYPQNKQDTDLSYSNKILISKKCFNGIVARFNISPQLINKLVPKAHDKDFFHVAEKIPIEVISKYNKSERTYTLIGLNTDDITDEDFLLDGLQNQQKFWHKIFADNREVVINEIEINKYEIPTSSKDTEYYMGSKLGAGKIITSGDIEKCAFVSTGVCANVLAMESDWAFLSIVGGYDLKTRLDTSKTEQNALYGLKVDGGNFQVTFGVSKPIENNQFLWGIMDDRNAQNHIMFDFMF